MTLRILISFKRSRAIEVDFFFENSDLFMVEVYDVDDETNLSNLSKQEFIGSY